MLTKRDYQIRKSIDHGMCPSQLIQSTLHSTPYVPAGIDNNTYFDCEAKASMCGVSLVWITFTHIA